jgi:hypothetical protein
MNEFVGEAERVIHIDPDDLVQVSQPLDSKGL